MTFPTDKQAQLKWIKTASNYLIGRATEMEYILNWAERFQSRTITVVGIATLRNSPWIRKKDPEKLSSDLWSFLNLTFEHVRDRAAFDNARAGNCFTHGNESWYLLDLPMNGACIPCTTM